MRNRPLFVVICILLCALLTYYVPPAHAQAPAPDSYEPNDSLTQAALIPVGSEIGSLTISPASDQDWFRVLVSPPATYTGSYRIEVIATPGLDLTLTVFGPNGSPIGTSNDPAGPNAAVSFGSTSEGYYAIQVVNTTTNEGWYTLRVRNLTPGPTPTPTITPTPTAAPTLQPTSTSPFPTNTATPELGGAPDYAEPNYDFATAYRIAPGDTLKNLNFNAGSASAIDNDFFVMAVRIGVTYTCRTDDLSEGVDTNIIVYNSANQQDVIGGNDDINTQAGEINSALTFTSGKEGDVYILVGYKYPQPNGLRYPGNATYTLSCIAAVPASPTPASASSGSGSISPIVVTPLSIEVFKQPEIAPTPTVIPIIPQTVDVLIGYDRNENREIDPTEAVTGISVRVIDAQTNRELSHGFTGDSGLVRFVLATDSPIRIVIPFLGAAEQFNPGSPVQWKILIPASNAPGLIP